MKHQVGGERESCCYSQQKKNVGTSAQLHPSLAMGTPARDLRGMRPAKDWAGTAGSSKEPLLYNRYGVVGGEDPPHLHFHVEDE